MNQLLKQSLFGISLMGGVMGLSQCATQAKKEAQKKKPNIIYILADDLGYGEVGCFGQKLIETPNIDKLATQGVKFTQHYSGSPVCGPSRCVLMTGKHSGHAYIRGNDEWASRGKVWDYRAMIADSTLEGQRPLPANTQTVARLLQGVGYTTGIVGKWGLGAPHTDGIPNKQGFDFFCGYNCQRQAHNYYPKHLYLNEKRIYLDNEVVVPGTKLDKGADPKDLASYAKYTQKQYSPDVMFEQLMGFVEKNQNEPFFLYWANPMPHVPIQAPQRWVDHYVKKFGDEQPYIGKKGYFPQRYPHAGYAAMISYMDEQVGILVDKLKELGLYENTLIVFTSDNGPTYNGGSDSPWFNSGGLFRSEMGWGKGFVNEGGIRIPMIATWPGHIEPGTQSDHISAFWDVLPTLCEVGGAKVPQDVDGISFLPSLKGEKSQKEHKFLYWEFPSYGGQQAIRMGKWKGIRKNIFKGNMTMELYNLDKDIQEAHNVADENPQIIKEMEKVLQEQHSQSILPKFRIEQIGDVKE